MKTKGVIKMTGIICLCLVLLGLLVIFALNAWVKGSTKDYIVTLQQAPELADMDCILVLGCQVRDSGEPSDMLKDRLDQGIALYEAGAAPKLLMSGDHGRRGYDEVGTMKQYAADTGIPEEDIFMDHAGFSTYESMYRAKEIFQAKKILIVTQEYHLYRSIYIARNLGLDAYGVAADQHIYAGQMNREVREILARCKDIVTTMFQVKPTYLGDAIPISGSGELTDD